MKKQNLFKLLSLFLVTSAALSQVQKAQTLQVGNTSTNTQSASAALQIDSTTRGLLPPRMTQAQRNAIVSPVDGLIIYCTNCGTTGELEVYNGVAWINVCGATAVAAATAGAPTSPVATAIYKQATVSFAAPASTGFSAITSYTVTSSPGSFSVTGPSSPLTVTGLTNGTSYTFTVVATNAEGNSSASLASGTVIPNCGAYVSAGVYKVFACYNLGATDTTADPNTPVQGIHGNYYQWGSKTVVADAYTSAGTISGWNAPPAIYGAWLDDSKTANDPCPAGFRVPTKIQWDGVIANNTITRTDTGTWSSSATNYAAAISFGTPTIKTLTLPAAGYRNGSDGTLFSRGAYGYYWSSTMNVTNAWNLDFNSSSAYTYNGFNRTYGFSVRCVSE